MYVQEIVEGVLPLLFKRHCCAPCPIIDENQRKRCSILRNNSFANTKLSSQTNSLIFKCNAAAFWPMASISATVCCAISSLLPVCDDNIDAFPGNASAISFSGGHGFHGYQRDFVVDAMPYCIFSCKMSATCCNADLIKRKICAPRKQQQD